MKILIVIISAFLSTELSAQLDIPHLLDPTKEDSIYFSSQLKTIRKASKFIIAFRTYSYWNRETPWYLLAVDTIGIIRKYITSDLVDFRKLQLTQDSLKKEVDIFVKHDIFSMKNTQNWLSGCDSCASMIFDGQEYSFMLFTQSQFKELSFYEPVFYVTCCTTVYENRRIVDIIKQLSFSD